VKERVNKVSEDVKKKSGEVGVAAKQKASSVAEDAKKWAHENLTIEGRTEKYEAKYTESFNKIKDKLSPADLDNAKQIIHARAEKSAKLSMVRDGVVAGVGAVGLGLGIWKRKEIGTFVASKTPEAIKKAPQTISKAAKEYGTKIRTSRAAGKVEDWVYGIRHLFQRTPPRSEHSFVRGKAYRSHG
jgi:hypothetical protein